MREDQMMRMIPRYTVESWVTILAEKLNYNHTMLNIPEMWRSTRGEGVKLAVLDTGVPNHPDLRPSGEHSVVPGYKYDTNGHATHCAGITSALADNDMGVAGIAPDVEDYYCAVLGGDGSGSVQTIINGIHWAMDNGMDILSMSLGIAAGAPKFRSLEKACNAAVDQGITIFAAAGNEYGAVGQPAVFDSVIAVGAVDNKKQHADFSNTGPEVDFAAGGVQVYSTYLEQSYAKLSGTSMACPALAAVGALILSKHMKAGTTLTPQELRNHILKIAYDVGPDGYDELYGHGIPIFGHRNPQAPQDPGKEPVDEPDGGISKPGPKANCAYWKLWNAFIGAVVDELDKPANVGCAVAAGLRALGSKTEAINTAIRKK